MSAPVPTQKAYGLGSSGNAELVPLVTVREAEVAAPGDMIALGDVYSLEFGYLPLTVPLFLENEKRLGAIRTISRKRHLGQMNLLFADGHIEARKPSTWFSRNESAIRRWHRDNLPHMEGVGSYLPVKD